MGHSLPRARIEVGGEASLRTDAPIQGRDATHQPKKRWAAAFQEGRTLKKKQHNCTSSLTDLMVLQ